MGSALIDESAHIVKVFSQSNISTLPVVVDAPLNHPRGHLICVKRALSSF